MKRIDDKIKEIEKKDKTNRILYIAFVVLIGVFMAYAFSSEKTKDQQKRKISELEIKQSDTYKELEDEKAKTVEALNDLEDAYKELKHEKAKTEKALSDLEKSLDPEEYWKHIASQNSVEDYIDYITNDFGIEKPYMSEALKNIQSPDVQGFEGWLYVGALKNDGIYNSKNIVDVIYRKDADGDIKNSKPQIGDVVKLKTERNRKTYKDKSRKRKNEEGWRNKTKAFVAEAWKDPKSTDFRIFVKYY